MDSVTQELLLGVARTKVCVGTKKAGIKVGRASPPNPSDSPHK